MFARKVAVRLKPDSLEKFTNLMDSAVLPWLRAQEGFQHMIVLATPDRSEVQVLSFWDQEGSAAAYSSTGYPAVVKILEGLLDTKPFVKTYEVFSSTLECFAPARDGTVSLVMTE